MPVNHRSKDLEFRTFEFISSFEIRISELRLRRAGYFLIEIKNFFQKREALLLLENPAERYEWLLREKPDFLHHLNLYEIASYLGVTQETLSRVRNRRANRISV